jgi:hypothetical protein
MDKEALGQSLFRFVPRYAGRFGRAGIATVGDLVEAIRAGGLIQSNHSQGGHYSYNLGKGPQVRCAGPKTWHAVLTVLDEVGFDWREYVVYRNPYARQPPTRMEVATEINTQIDRLIRLLQAYQELVLEEAKSDDL